MAPLLARPLLDILMPVIFFFGARERPLLVHDRVVPGRGRKVTATRNTTVPRRNGARWPASADGAVLAGQAGALFISYVENSRPNCLTNCLPCGWPVAGQTRMPALTCHACHAFTSGRTRRHERSCLSHQPAPNLIQIKFFFSANHSSNHFVESKRIRAWAALVHVRLGRWRLRGEPR